MNAKVNLLSQGFMAALSLRLEAFNWPANFAKLFDRDAKVDSNLLISESCWQNHPFSRSREVTSDLYTVLVRIFNGFIEHISGVSR